MIGFTCVKCTSIYFYYMYNYVLCHIVYIAGDSVH